MSKYFDRQALNCINDFLNLMKSQDYISLKKYNRFLDTYADIFLLNNKHTKSKYYSEKLTYISNKGYLVLRDHNNKWLDKERANRDNFLTNIFSNVDLNIKLDDEQIKAILSDEDYCLVIAGAGGGKTTTIVGKVSYLVNVKKIDPSKIVVISFTNKATQELEERIIEKLNIPINITTFHALGMRYIRKLSNNPVKVLTDFNKTKILEKYIIDELFCDKQEMDFIIQNFPNTFASNFIKKYENFDTFDDYFEDYKKRKFEEEKDNIKAYNENRIDSLIHLDTPISIKGEACRSLAEAEIANFLFVNGIDYEYEQMIPEKVDEDRSYSPDFALEFQGKKIYIEYFGLSNKYNANHMSDKLQKKYEKERQKKLEFFKKKDGVYDLIELDYQMILNDQTLSYLEALQEELLKRGITFKPKSDSEIFYQLLDNNKSAEFFKFINLIFKAISTIKEEGKLDNYKDLLLEWVNNHAEDEFEQYKLKNQVIVLEKFINYYQQTLKQNNYVDYSDMIINAYKFFDELNDGNHELEYEYIIIDEYQDISFSKYLLTKKISDAFNAKIMAVGDDWQSIFSFTGSDIKLFYDFNNLFPDSETFKISNIYRHSQELVDIASGFILQNPEQIYKDLISNKSLNHPIEICYYDKDYEFYQLNKLIKSIYKHNPKDRILILSRLNKSITELKYSKYFSEGFDNQIICKACPNADITALTIHSSKGLGYDQVIVLNLEDNIVPLNKENDFWITKAIKPTMNSEKFPFAEERRLFYVALTRTKNKVYLLAPSINQSRFIKELIIEQNVTVNE